MATGIGQQIREMVGRARHYWAELTDEKDNRQQAQHRREEEEVHQRYGGVRGQDESLDADPPGRAENLADRSPPHATPPGRAARGGNLQGGRPGSQRR